mmetsp:Transcript_38921/g.74678  ORF Transcript_38921/g.74678 Transcript_38921/m.74678 type:complete len:119 (-) Transcript_38921:147-503(-)
MCELGTLVSLCPWKKYIAPRPICKHRWAMMQSFMAYTTTGGKTMELCRIAGDPMQTDRQLQTVLPMWQQQSTGTNLSCTPISNQSSKQACQKHMPCKLWISSQMSLQHCSTLVSQLPL